MIKKKKIIVILGILIVFFFGIIYTVLPYKYVDYYSGSNKKMLVQSLMSVNDAKISNQMLEVSLNEGNINQIIASVSSIDQCRVILNENDADFYMPIELVKIIKTNVKAIFDLKAENNKLKIKVKEVRLGKLRIDNKHIMDYIKAGTYNDVYVEKCSNNIYISCKNVDINDAYIKNNEIFVKCRLNLKGIINELTNKIIYD